MATLKLVCRAGFKYVGYQRVSAILKAEGVIGGTELEANVSEPLAKLLNLLSAVSQLDVPPLVVAEDGLSFFIESGESFTLDAFSEGVAGLLSELVVVPIDG